MSELMRTAPTPSFGATPSIDLQAVERVGARGRREAVGARARDAAPFRQFDIGLFHHIDAFAHRQQLLDIVVGQDQGHMRCGLCGG